MMRGKEMPGVSVVMPVRNGGAALAAAIASIRAQTWRDWELIAIDDGSTDDTRARLNAAAGTDPRIRVLRPGPVGLVAALNLGLAAARGRFIARMDADDVSHPDRLAEQVAFLAAPENAAIGLVGCLVDFGGAVDRANGFALHVAWLNSLVTADEISRSRFVESPLAHPSVVFRRELVSQFGGYEAGDFPEDYELWLRWLAAGVKMAKVPRGLLTWNDPPGRMSRTDSRYDPDAFYRVKAPWIARAVRDTGRVFVWGAGRHTRKRAAHLGQHGLRIAGYIDVDAKKISPALGGTGLPVLSYTALPPPGEIVVLSYVSSRGAREFNRGELLARGYVEGRDFFLCA